MDCVLMLIHIVFGLVCVLFFFFKQKTAYEMRISDWSSDVCSSDLTFPGGALNSGLYLSARRGCRCGHRQHRSKQQRRRQPSTRNRGCADFCQETHSRPTPRRSEEHTSELQSLMRISYAVYCLIQQKHNYSTRDDTQHELDPT